ncbi:MAG: hypothetical protein A3F54_05700 [Candidatus Kerfeldbacteria bacterium RIFCSPHIGHO2_12_FULL_48_17]|uniref:DNA recombination protein RmuC n=1 Tax=Candidatus Kerfeldbacteria bacterium RIFCSPHIGHO2_12_FULL_48_17 TaxID=1798542 RepID=A0A1G2B5Z9_9BACT|nr:MAG: hypothetical protein A3F54_05700 [Candidatus Kerfeldbacteria bacterium RIFCSPHIGHO2_12_FULL_48_17]
METLLIILAIALLIGIIAVIFLLQRNHKAAQTPPDDQSQKLMLDLLENVRREVQQTSGQHRQETQARLDTISQQVQQGLTSSSKAVAEQFRQSTEIIKDITGRLSKLDSTNQQVLGFAQQMQNLENILKNPKHRGILGEYFLENMLNNVLQPRQYKMQYAFKNGEIVDAAIFYREQIIPVDSKFSLEKYNRIIETQNPDERVRLEKEFHNDVKLRIDETSKYIRPQEGTTDFAFMFIPAEGIYNSLLSQRVGTVAATAQDMREYAFKKKVIIVSPTTFYAYLQTVLQGLKGAQTEKNIQVIVKRIDDLGRHLTQYQEYFNKLGGHLGTTVSSYNRAAKELGKVDKDVVKITEGASGGEIAVQLLDKPELLDED